MCKRWIYDSEQMVMNGSIYYGVSPPIMSIQPGQERTKIINRTQITFLIYWSWTWRGYLCDDAELAPGEIPLRHLVYRVRPLPAPPRGPQMNPQDKMVY